MQRAAYLAIFLAAGALLFPVASADTEPLRMHGVVQTFDGNYLTIKADSGKTLLVGIQPQTRIIHSRMMALADLKSGDYVATLAMQDANGKLHVQSVRVFANAVPAAGEGQYKLDSNPSRVVTNGTVRVVSPSDGSLSLTFHGASGDGAAPCTGHAPPGGWGCTGNADLWIARGVPIIAITNGDTSLLRPGAIVSVTAASDAAGLLSASGVSVERDAKPAQ
jgi:hypothetical protein